MSFLSSIFHRHKSSNSPRPDHDKTETNCQIPQSCPQERISYSDDWHHQQEHRSRKTDASNDEMRGAMAQYVPGTGPAASSQTHQANMIGMGAGAFIGAEMGGDPVMGMIEGQIGANFIMQRIQQEQRHQHYREQALRYRAGLPADGIAGQEIGESKRDEKRRKRWERRAKRREGGNMF